MKAKFPVVSSIVIISLTKSLPKNKFIVLLLKKYKLNDLDKKIYYPVRSCIGAIKYARNYNQIYEVLEQFMRIYIKLPFFTAKSKEWIDAYKGEGAFYTLKNLVMFHNCGIKVDKFDVRFGISAVGFLNEKLVEYNGEGWRMFALMKKVIEDNNFDFKARMEEIYHK